MWELFPFTGVIAARSNSHFPICFFFLDLHRVRAQNFSLFKHAAHPIKKEDVMKGQASKLSRRNFLLAVGAGGAATAAAVVASKSPQTQPKKAEAVGSSRGYHVTEHIRKYYNTAKI